MMTKIAHMRENRKANKGFSLVELIIVMAIMVALVAVLAPQYIRYLQRSRDSVVANAAEDVMTALKTDLIDPEGELRVASGATATVTIAAEDGNGKVTLTPSANITGPDSVGSYIADLVGLSDRKVKSSKTFEISITNNSGQFSFSMTSNG